MPFCSSCGASFNSGSKFCMRCGNPIVENKNIVAQKSAPVSAISQQRSIRVESANEVARMLEYFSPMQSKYDEYDQCCKNVDMYSKKSGASALVVGLIFCVIAIGASVFVLLTHGSEGLPFLIVSGVFLFFGIVLIYCRIDGEKRRKKIYAESLTRQAVLANELTNYYNNYGEICLVGAEFSNPRILTVLGNTLRQGRADTIKEAINVMFDDAHKTQMELQAQLTTQAARQAAGGATTAAAFSAARFFVDGIRLFL